MVNLKKKAGIFLNKLRIGKRILQDDCFIKTNILNQLEIAKRPRRTEIINYLLELTNADNYLEIGVRDPKKNFVKINCKNKYSVDPGVEFEENPVDFKMTSDIFFEQLNNGQLKEIDKNIKFDVIFIDGLHISSQVEKDIQNSLKFIKDNGFIILHDCNPPSEYHQRENYDFKNSPAGPFWNGTTWKAFYKFRHQLDLFSICFDSDWGVGVISKTKTISFNNIEGKIKNEYYEFSLLEKNRNQYLNLQQFEEWKKVAKK
jgi:hypothetical protein